MTAAWLITLTVGFGLGFLCGAALLVWLATGPEENLPPDAEPLRLTWPRRPYDREDEAA